MVLTDPEISVSTAPHRKFIHIDMDAFYASVEQRDNPDLCGKPVAVDGSPERGVVAAASYEARRCGVRSAMPSVTAKRQCPDLIFVKPRFEVYKTVSRQIREILVPTVGTAGQTARYPFSAHVRKASSFRRRIHLHLKVRR